MPMRNEGSTDDDWSGWIPVLWTADAPRSARFYCEILGFTKDWEHRFAEGWPLYLQVSRGPIRLHLSEHGEGGASVSLCMGVPDVDATYTEFTARGLEAESPPQDREYGIRDFAFKDPSGHHLVFCTRLESFDDAPGRTNAASS